MDGVLHVSLMEMEAEPVGLESNYLWKYDWTWLWVKFIWFSLGALCLPWILGSRACAMCNMQWTGMFRPMGTAE